MKSKNKKAKAKGKWTEWLGSWAFGLGQLFFAIVLTGMVLYLVAQYKTGSFQPFELATVAGLLGGFPLVAAFGEKVDDEGMRNRLKMIGGLYLFAAICFVVFGFYQAADMAKLVPTSGAGTWMFKVIYVTTFYGGALALIFGMWTSLEMLPRLLRLRTIWDRVGDGVRKIFGKKDKWAG